MCFSCSVHNICSDLFNSFIIFKILSRDTKIYPACPLLLDMWAVPIFLLASDDAIINIFVHLAFLLLLNYFLMVESQEWGYWAKGRNISLVLAMYNLKLCFENYFSYCRGKVKAQLLMVRITWGKWGYFPGSLLFCPFSQPSVFPVHLVNFNFIFI